jgi:hypothetical protein
MSYTEKPSTIRFGGVYASGQRESEMFRPNERNASAEALICLQCPLPDCNKLVCKRYNEEARKIREQHNDRIQSRKQAKNRRSARQ